MKRNKKTILYIASAFLLLFALWLWILPFRLFEGTSYSTVVCDREGRLLGARISKDEQWRFPPSDSLPEKYKKCLVRFEDRGFYGHLGISPSATMRAAWHNAKAGRVKSGASTITMQVARMNGGRGRTLWSKMVEACEALRIEARYGKEEILRLYASHAPYGGNVVGYSAGCWRYLGHDGSRLSWGEAALMAVLQNSPSLTNLRKGREKLKEKRNRLLKGLYKDGAIAKEEYELAIQEPLPESPQKIPSMANHLVEWYAKRRNGEYVRTTVSLDAQLRVEQIAKRRNEELRTRGVNDLAVVVIDVRNGDVVAYCGNANTARMRAGVCVDVVRAKRSSGSLLKPLLYCAALQDGYILPNSLIADVPININGFRPHNYDMEFRGAVGAREAVSKSLNVPNVLLLRDYGVGHFLEVLSRCGITTLTRGEDAYGLSLILGGGEVELLEITRAYAKMARNYEYGEGAVKDDENKLCDNPAQKDGFESSFFLTDKAAIYYTIEAMRRVERADHLDIYKVSGMKEIAWKTGTSYGARDAWSVGFDRRYAVGVWAGNAEGHGVAELSGVHTASPVMFDVFNTLTYGNRKSEERWFKGLKAGDGVKLQVCKKSGMQAGLECPETEEAIMPKVGYNSTVCSYHHTIKLTLDGTHRETDPLMPSKDTVFFSLPANMEYYYKKYHPEYASLPPLKDAFADSKSGLAFIYPQNGSVLSCVGESSDKSKGILFHLAHKRPSTEVFWFLDGAYLGSTIGEHKMLIDMEEGKHKVSVVDEMGDKAEVRFENRE